jgi:SOS-response transcriptional repressor LexA
VILTKRQRDALVIISDAIARTGMSPTMDEIASGLGLKGKSNAWRAVDDLVRIGAVRRMPHKRQAIEVLWKPRVGYFKFDDETKSLRPYHGTQKKAQTDAI